MVDRSLDTGIRLALGCFKSSFVESLRNLANESPPDIRTTRNIPHYGARTLKNTDNSANKYLTKSIKEAE